MKLLFWLAKSSLLSCRLLSSFGKEVCVVFGPVDAQVILSVTTTPNSSFNPSLCFCQVQLNTATTVCQLRTYPLTAQQ